MQNSIFPMKVMSITATYNSNASHRQYSNGKDFKDYPTDLNGKDTGRDAFYAPFDCEIKRVRIAASNGLWIQSTNKVNTPIGEYYITMLLQHPQDIDNLKPGQKFKQGQIICHEGNAGNSTGNHIHLAIATGKYTGSGWRKNNLGAWPIHTTGKPIKIEEAFFVDPKFTTKIRDDKKIDFLELGETKTQKVTAPKYKVGSTYKTRYECQVRTGPGTNYAKVKYEKLTDSAKKHDLDKDGCIDANTNCTCKKVVVDGSDVWVMIPSGYIRAYDGKKVYLS